MQRIWISLVMDLSDDASAGAGWYVRAQVDSNTAVEPTAISTESAYEAARAIQEALQSTDGELPQIPLPQLVESGSKLIRTALEDQIREYEAKAALIGPLRKKLGKITATDPS